MLRKIHLYGALAKESGVDSIELDVNSPRELISGLKSQIKDFRQLMIKHPTMHVILSNEDKSVVDTVSAETFEFPLSDNAQHVHLVSTIEGSGVEFAAWLVMSMEIGWGTAVLISSVVTNLAVSVVVGLISSVLSSSPDTSEGSGSADQRPSFLFNGAVNVIEQGYPVPLVYGVHTTGSIVVSAGVDVAEIPYVSAQEAAPANGGGDIQPTVPPVEVDQWQYLSGSS